MDSILQSVKKFIGVDVEYDVFDVDIIMIINSVLNALTQIGVGPTEGFSISDETATWDDFIQDNILLNSVKPYVSIRTRLVFDPPQSSSLTQALDAAVKELEWRISLVVDSGNEKNQS